MLSRKNFIYTSALGVLPLSLAPSLLRCSSPLPPQDEDFWQHIRSQFIIPKDLINLNNGGVSPQPLPVQKVHEENLKLCNNGPSFYMWRQLDKQREPLRQRLADTFGCAPTELAINRNTTEGLNTIIAGLPLKAGDEVVLSKYDYPNMMNAWQQREMRDGIVLKWVDLPLPAENDDEIVQLYANAITSKTKIVHVTHVINWNGQVLPVKKISQLAHQKGCEVIVDGAHSFANIDFKLGDLDCDYFATSLHKWLCAPFGTGLMYIKKQHITKIWPLLSAYPSQKEDIRKFEMLGTRSFGAEMAINEAIDFHEAIGIERKQARMHYLKNYLIKQLQQNKKVKLYTSAKSNYSINLVAFELQGSDGNTLTETLLKNHKINTTPIVHHSMNGVRIVPHFFTSTKELDLLVQALKGL